MVPLTLVCGEVFCLLVGCHCSLRLPSAVRDIRYVHVNCSKL